MKLKIAIIGASGCGKTFVSNILGAEGGGAEGAKTPYRPTHSVRIVEFTCPSLILHKYTLDVDVQLWEVGGDPAVKSVWPGCQWGLDGIIVMYDVGKESSIREASNYFMTWVTHSSAGLNPSQALLIGNKFRGSAEQGPQRIVGVPPRVHHIAVNIEDDPQRLREDVKVFVARIAQMAIDQEKANLITGQTGRENRNSRKLTPAEYHALQEDFEELEKHKEKEKEKVMKQLKHNEQEKRKSRTKPISRSRTVINVTENV